VNVKNTSSRPGDEVVQLYVEPPGSAVTRPVHELRGFQRVHLGPGQSAQATFVIDETSFRHWDLAGHGWERDPGDYIIQVGDSSRDLRHQAHLSVSPILIEAR
jgi:beta-glucosidase